MNFLTIRKPLAIPTISCEKCDERVILMFAVQATYHIVLDPMSVMEMVLPTQIIPDGSTWVAVARCKCGWHSETEMTDSGMNNLRAGFASSLISRGFESDDVIIQDHTSKIAN